MAKTLTHGDLDQFTGTEQWYRHGLVRWFLYTDGVQYMAEHGGAYWLIDAIASHQIDPKIKRSQRLQEFQLWTLKVNPQNHSAVLVCQADSGEKAVVTQEIEYTDFPLDEIKFYVEPMGDGKFCLLLPSEH